MRRTGMIGWAGVLSALLFAPAAYAQDATTLFKQGLAAFQDGETAKACSLFEKSFAADPATGTLYNMAKCHATERHYWDARGEFLKLAAEMDAAGKPNKAKIAREQAAAAEAHVPKIALAFPPNSNIETIAIDGNEIDTDKWKTPIPVAPGQHVLTLAAERFKKQQRSVEADAGGATVRVELPVLKGRGTIDETSTVSLEGSESPDHNSAHQGGWTARTTGLVIGAGVTAVGLAAGVGFAVAAAGARSKRDDLLDQLRHETGESNPCGTSPAPSACASVMTDNNAATNDRTGEIVGFTLAGVAAAGTVVFVLWPRHSNDAALVPVVGRHVAGLAAVGWF